jgi:hypothetical protein
LATVIEPVRSAPWFGATTNATVPLPVPAAADVSEIHPTSVAAVQAQSPSVGTISMLPEPPPELTLWLDGAIA